MSEANDKIIGGFRILQEIQSGSGSQGTVYKAVCEEDKNGLVPCGSLVALKVMAVQDDGKLQWKRLEARTKELCRLNHPNVVRYFGCFSESGLFNDVHVVVQEYLEGLTLKERLSETRSGIDVDTGLRIADAALAGLEYISRCGIVHRDIKPGNIFLCADGSVKLIDFEIAKQRDGTTTSTAGNIRGSFDYMAPDFTDPDFHGDEKSDVFSMAVVVHEILTGKTPYQRLDGDGKQANFAFLSRWSKALSDGSNPIYISSRVKRLLANAVEVLEKALSPERAERYGGFSEFRSALRKIKFRTLRNGTKSYQILQFIGKGGFGEVFKARSRSTGEFVAVKHLLKANYAERFHREAKIMKKLDSPCFVRLVDFFVMDAGNSREAFLVMSFLDGMPGSSLRDAIRSSDGGIAARDVFTAFERYAYGLEAMHASGIYHRDIKPSNLYYPKHDPSKAAIMDLGIARDVNGTATHGQVPGTLDYMPPEVVLTDSRGDGGMDVYALGLCLYEALTGKTAYPRLPTGTASYAAFFERARSKAMPSFADPAVANDVELAGLLADMTNPDPDSRIGNAGEVARRISGILRTRFGDVGIPPPDAAGGDSPVTVASAEALAPTVAADPVTGITAVTRPGMAADAIRKERRRYLVKRFGAAVAAVSVLLSIVAGIYLSWNPVREFLSRRSRQAAVVENLKADIASCVRENGALHEGNFAELGKKSLPDADVRLHNGLSGDLRKLSLAIAVTVRANLGVEPPLTRRSRLARSKQILSSKWAQAVLPPGEASLLKREIQSAEKICVSIVKNGCSNPIWIDGSEIKPGGSKVMVYEDGHPENGIVSRPGFNSIHLPKDIDGRVHEIDEKAFTAKPVRFSLPPFGPGVRCELDGRSRNPGETVELMPGYYKCRYSRDTYKTQEFGFSVYANAAVTVPSPGEWVHTDGFLKREKELAAEKESREERKRRRLESELAEMTAALKEATKEEPVETRRSRLDAAAEIVEKACRDGVITEGRGKELAADIGRRKGWTVGKIVNKGAVALEAGGMVVAGGEAKLTVFENGIPADWSYSAAGYDPAPLPAEFDGKVVEISVSDLTPSAVKMRSGRLDHGVTCSVDGVGVKDFIELRPGDYVCVYRKNGYADQTVAFKVKTGVPGTLPRPGEWRALPVTVKVGSLARGVTCRIDGAPVGDTVTLSPGNHRCVYSLEDHEDQSFVFAVAPAAEFTLPPPGLWKQSAGLSRLEAAERAAKAGDWIKAKAAISFATVTAPDNRRRRLEIETLVANQSKLSEKREQAELYYEEGLYYDAVRYYAEAAEIGCVLSGRDQKNMEHAYETAKKRLQTMIDRCHKDIALGKSPIRPLADLESEMRRLIEWRTSVKGAR